MTARSLATALAAAALVTCALEARAADEELATVVLVTAREIMFDRGTDHDVEVGDRVRIYRKVVVHHPVTGATIEDRFPIGESRVVEASQLLSVIRNGKRLKPAPQIGDLVEVLRAAPAAPVAPAAASPPPEEEPAAPPAEPPASAAPTVDEETQALIQAFTAGMGQPIAKRHQRYFDFLRRYPYGQYAGAVGREISWLTARQAQDARAAAARRTEPEPLRVLHAEPGRVPIGGPGVVTLAVLPPERVLGGRLFARRAGDADYTALPLERTGRFYLRGALPAGLLEHPGAVEYFVEVDLDKQQVQQAVGSPQAPRRVVVYRPKVDAPERRDRSVFSASFDYVSFDTRGQVRDDYLSFEADYFYRIRTFLYGIRMGVGIFDGTGGELAGEEALIPETRDLAANYGYLELEFEVVPIFHFMLRGLAGNHHSPEDGSHTAVGLLGLEAGIRLGEEQRTNLLLSGAIVQDVGYEGRLSLWINEIRRVPIVVEGIVTTFPVKQSDLGLRLVLGSGYRFTDWLALLLKVSWNARTIKHTGFGGGASLAFSW